MNTEELSELILFLSRSDLKLNLVMNAFKSNDLHDVSLALSDFDDKKAALNLVSLFQNTDHNQIQHFLNHLHSLLLKSLRLGSYEETFTILNLIDVCQNTSSSDKFTTLDIVYQHSWAYNNQSTKILKKIFNVNQVSNNGAETLKNFIEVLEPNVLVSVLTSMAPDLCSNSLLTKEIVENKKLLSKLQCCFEYCYDFPLLKRSIFFLQFLIEHSKNEQKSLYCNIDAFNSFLMLFETLMETQGHIIKPVLPLIINIKDFVIQGKLDGRWMFISFNRLLSQESKLISRWGMQLLLDIDPRLWLIGDNLVFLLKLLTIYLNKTYMFYRPNFVPKGHPPPLVGLLHNYFSFIFQKMSNEQSNLFLSSLFNFLSSHSCGTNPLVYILSSLTNVVLPGKLSSQFIKHFIKMNRFTLQTQPPCVKGFVQGQLLDFINVNINHDNDFLHFLQLYLNDIWLNFSFQLTHNIWAKLANSIEDTTLNLSMDSSSITGLGILIALRNCNSDTVILQDGFIYTLTNCGVNLYTSKEKVFNAIALANVQYGCWAEDRTESLLLNAIHFLKKAIFDACLTFYFRWCNEDHVNDERNRKYLYEVADFLINLSDTSAISAVLEQINTLSTAALSDVIALGVLISSFYKKHHHLSFPTPDSCGITEDFAKAVTEHVNSADVLECECAWTCFSFITINNLVKIDVVPMYNKAVDHMERLTSHLTLEILYLSLENVGKIVSKLDPSSFINSIRPLWVTFEDLINLSVYWNLLEKFCNLTFSSAVLNNELLRSTLCFWWDRLLSTSQGKEGIIHHLVKSLVRYKPQNTKIFLFWYKRYVDLTIYGVAQSRVKQNTDDITAYISNLKYSTPVNMVYQQEAKSAALIRLRAINYLYRIMKDDSTGEVTHKVLDYLFEIFKSFEKPALINSLPNRIRIRIVQCILLLIPVIIRRLDPAKVLSRLVMIFTMDTQTSVRCFVEISVCYILDHVPKLSNKILDSLRKFDQTGNSYLTSMMSILHHHIKNLVYKNEITKIFMFDSLKVYSVWCCHNNHTVRHFASFCFHYLCDSYISLFAPLPEQFSPLETFYSESNDFQAHYNKMSKGNIYFRNFIFSRDICLANIMNHLPKHYHVLENELCDMDCVLAFTENELEFPCHSGSFSKIPVAIGDEQKNYLIKFEDIQRPDNVQKKITPWQIMASNLGVVFDRGTCHKGDLILYASFIDKANNLGGLSRTSEIFGVRTIVINNFDIMNNKEFKSLSLTSEKWLQYEENRNSDSSEYFKRLKKEGYTIIGVEQTANSVSLEEYNFPRKSLLVLGRERDGIPVDLIDDMDVCIEIPQLGLIRSLNVHVSASICIWEYCRQHLFSKESTEKQGS